MRMNDLMNFAEPLMFDLEEVFRRLEISAEKQAQLRRKTQIMHNLEEVYSGRDMSNKLLYTLACTASRKIDLGMIADLVEAGLIKHESMLKECMKYAERSDVSEAELRRFAEENDVGRDRICEEIERMMNEGVKKKEMMMEMRRRMPCANFKVVSEEVGRVEDGSVEADHEHKCRGPSVDWLEEGELKKLFKPGENPQLNEKIMEEHLKRTGGRVVTRFPPEPNGILHIGHAKAMNLSFEYARRNGGYTYLRYDDTNPRKEEEGYFESIYEDVKWLGFEPYKVTASSDYFGRMIEFGFELIRKGKAYVCHLSQEEMCERRRMYFSEGNGDRKYLSKYRDRCTEENMRIFGEMIDGKWKEGEACLRFKMDVDSKNPLMFDLVGMRIVDVEHPVKKVNFHVYPTYEFALCVSDSLEDVTHSFCTREFYTRQESYNWLLDQLEIYKPVQWEFSRLNISNTVLSKRKLVPLQKYGISLDDPRLFTIKGMRRRGFPASAINEFCRSVGYTYAETTVDVRILENFVRAELNKTARRVMCVKDPLKVTIVGVPECVVRIPDIPGCSEYRDVRFTPVVYIERSDFQAVGEEGFERLTLDQPVGLYMLYSIKVVKVTDDGLIAEMSDAMPKKFIHWVSEDCVDVEMRMYSALWASFNPDEGDYINEVNKESLKIYKGKCDKRILDARIEDKLQFQRIGYFCVDRDTSQEKVVVNLTIPLRNTV